MLCSTVAFLDVGYDGDGVAESAWTTTAYSCYVRFREHTRGPGKNEEESATLLALTVNSDCVLDFCLERDSYDSGYCKTTVFVLITAPNKIIQDDEEVNLYVLLWRKVPTGSYI